MKVEDIPFWERERGGGPISDQVRWCEELEERGYQRRERLRHPHRYVFDARPKEYAQCNVKQLPSGPQLASGERRGDR